MTKNKRSIIILSASMALLFVFSIIFNVLSLTKFDNIFEKFFGKKADKKRKLYNGMIKCRCGYEKSLEKDDIEEQYTMEGEKNPELKVIVTDNKNVALPTTKITCYKCGGTKGYWWTVQTRSADEAPTNFIRCAKCGNTWRSSN